MKWKAKCKAMLCALLLTLAGAPRADAAGTTPLALAFQFDESGQHPLVGCLLYFYVAGTVATPQQVFQDFGLSQPAPNPMTCSAGGRVPQHWLADGLVHLRLTDATGVVQLDTTMQVLGPSGGGGGGGGGGGIDPNAVAQTGDIKFRLSAETLNGFGWVVLNGATIGNEFSGATGRRNADTQNLFVYLWHNCTDLANRHCPVLGGFGTTALADFNAGKQLTLPDMRGRTPVGLDCMNATTCAGRLSAGNITSGGGDGVNTPGASGGQANQTATTTLTAANIPSGLSLPVAVSVGVSPDSFGVGVTIPAHTLDHAHGPSTATSFITTGTGGATAGGGSTLGGAATTSTYSQGQINLGGSGSGTGRGSASCDNCFGSAASSAPFSDMAPFLLGTFYIKL